MKLIPLLIAVAACGGARHDPAPANTSGTSERTREPDPDPHAGDADHRVEAAERERDEAVKAAKEANEKVDKLAHDLEELDKRVTDAIDSVVAAQNDADRASAKAKLEQLRRDKAEMEQRIAAAKAAAAKAAREKGKRVSKECLDNPLAKGCE